MADFRLKENHIRYFRFIFDSIATKDLTIKCYMTANCVWSNSDDLYHLMDDHEEGSFRGKNRPDSMRKEQLN